MKRINRPQGILAWFVHNPVAANLLMLAILILGLCSALIIRTESFPSFPPNTITIFVPFPGGSPQEVEEGVAIKIEEALNGVDGIKKISSAIDENGASVTINKNDGYSLARLKDDVKLRIDSISSFPVQAEKVVISEEQAERQVVNVEVHGLAGHYTLKESARRVRDELLKLPEVNKVTTEGARVYEVNVELREAELRRFNVSFDDVAQAIQKNSINLSGGRIKTNAGVISLRTAQQRYYRPDFESIIVRSDSRGGHIRIRDIATVNDGYEEQQYHTRFNRHPTVSLSVRLLGNDSITDAATAVRKRIHAIQQEKWLPEGVELTSWYDESLIIRDRLSLMSKNALSGITLVLIMLALFLNLRVAAWVALGIPISFAGAFLVMGPSFLNYSLNELTTFGFIVVLGIVVDDAIVIGESIYSEKEKLKGKDNNPSATTITGASKVVVPATFGVLTTVAAFLPLTLISSEMGKIFGAIAVVVIVCLIFSLIESKWILPAHLAHLDINKKSHHPIAKQWERLQKAIESGLQRLIHQHYTPLLKTVIQYRYTALCVFIAAFILVIGLLPSGIVRTVFFPDIEIEVAKAELKVHAGLGVEHTKRITQAIEDAAYKTSDEFTQQYDLNEPAIKYIYAFSIEEDKAQAYIEIVGGSQREFPVQDVVNAWRKNIGVLQGVEYLDISRMGPGAENDIEVELSGPDNARLNQAAQALERKLASYQGVYDIKQSQADGNTELQIELKPEAYTLGLSYSDVAHQVRNAIYGFEAQRIQRGRDEVKVKVRYPQNERRSQTDLDKIRIRTPNSGTVPLLDIVELQRGESPSSIYRIDKQRVIAITARSDKSTISAREVLGELSLGYFPELQQQYPGISINLDGEAAEEERAMRSLGLGFLLALTLIYALLAIPLKSYSEPLVIMFAIPFGIIGAIIGHLIVGIDMSILSFFGLLALSGVVVNDSLVLTSRFNDLKQQGLGLSQAISEAGVSRFRAIFLTSITTFVGLLPLLAERSLQAKFLIPMAVSLGFGILFATVITLLIIPVLLCINHDLRHWWSKKITSSHHSKTDVYEEALHTEPCTTTDQR